MTTVRTWMKLAVLVVLMAVGLNRVAAQTTGDASRNRTAGQPRMAFFHSLPRLDGAHLKATIVEVTYGPGESSPPHSHPCAVIGYVIEGALRTQVKGEAEAVYNAGQGFYEAPNGVHTISANASDKVPVKFLAYFICDHDTALTVPPLASPAQEGNRP